MSAIVPASTVPLIRGTNEPAPLQMPQLGLGTYKIGVEQVERVVRDALDVARLRGDTPWAALGRLGTQLRIDELRDLSAALALVAEDGAKIRESLGARASSMRRRDLSDAEGKAGENSESMLVAQLVVAMGFIVFLVYPALTGIIGSV